QNYIQSRAFARPGGFSRGQPITRLAGPLHSGSFLMRTLVCVALLALLGAALLAAEENKDDDKGTALFNGTDLNGWNLLDPKATDRSKWSVVGAVRLKADLPGQFDFDKGAGILLNGGDGKGINLLSETEHADCELHVEFNVSKGSNSGVYFMGRYEVQILDS